MPRTRSAKKNARKTVKRTLRNKLRKERLKKIVRAFQDTLKKKSDEATVKTSLVKAQRAIDKAGSKGWIHKNTVNRKKSRLARAANKAKAAAKA